MAVTGCHSCQNTGFLVCNHCGRVNKCNCNGGEGHGYFMGAIKSAAGLYWTSYYWCCTKDCLSKFEVVYDTAPTLLHPVVYDEEGKTSVGSCQNVKQ